MLNNHEVPNDQFYPSKEEFLLLFEGLTKRQKEIVIKKFEGMSNEEIALECGIKDNTVRKHISNACARLNISDPHKLRNDDNRENLAKLGTMYFFDREK